ncbi:MAG: formate/nitrite transporter family protein [Oscillospiraceae bacterium]|jgi:formate/nitrite transporter|nr:formate/nitrite transporter family protein [Oscillospiraceae bacterium]
MQVFSPREVIDNYAQAARRKTERSAGGLLALAVLAGALIAFGSVATNTAAHALPSVSLQRIASALIFPFGLGMLMLTGTELFTGNMLLVMPVLSRRISLMAMLRNWALVYLGNAIGSVIVAACCVFCGQLELSGGELAVYTMRIAAAKNSLPFINALVLGVLCNVLVCVAVLCSLSAKDTPGRIMGAYLPVAFFVLCGFEHCVANFYAIPAGMFAAMVPRYADLARAAGVNLEALTVGRLLFTNQVPVVLGNVIGGALVGVVMWGTQGRDGSVQ